MSESNTDEILIQILETLQEIRKAMNQLQGIPPSLVIEKALKDKHEMVTEAVAESFRHRSMASEKIRNMVNTR